MAQNTVAGLFIRAYGLHMVQAGTLELFGTNSASVSMYRCAYRNAGLARENVTTSSSVRLWTTRQEAVTLHIHHLIRDNARSATHAQAALDLFLAPDNQGTIADALLATDPGAPIQDVVVKTRKQYTPKPPTFDANGNPIVKQRGRPRKIQPDAVASVA